MGRVGLDLHAADPSVVVAVVQTELTGRRAPGQEEPTGGPAYLGVQSGPATEGGVRMGFVGSPG